MKCPPDKEALARIRRMPCCWCQRPAPSEAAHLWTKGFGGAYRNDHPLNTCPLCRDCHQSHHDGHHPRLADLLLAVSRREGVPVDVIRTFNERVRQAPKGSCVDAILRDIAGPRDRRPGPPAEAGGEEAGHPDVLRHQGLGTRRGPWTSF